MKILLFAHQLEVGGTQLNAIELAAHLRDYKGHDVCIFARPGPMSQLIEEKGLRYFPSPDSPKHPSWARMMALLDLVKKERPDVIHVWDWPQVLDSYYGAYLIKRVPMVVTCMSMTLDRQLPKFLYTTFGTPELVEEARARGWAHPRLLLPPVDVDINAPRVVDAQPFIDRFKVRPDELTIVTVSRLVAWMKEESIRDTIQVVRTMGRRYPLRFILVGDGTSREALQQLADQANIELGREAISLTGAMIDPRPAYAAASIIVGMGGSALRGMAFSKPVIIVGEGGFAKVFTSQTCDIFMHRGIYGIGSGDEHSDLKAAITDLIAQRHEFSELGAFSREFVVRQFSLESVSSALEDILGQAVALRESLGLVAFDGFRTAVLELRKLPIVRPLSALYTSLFK